MVQVVRTEGDYPKAEKHAGEPRMKFRIHYTLQGDIEDSFILDGDSIEEMREMAESELTRRGGVDPWSEDLTEPE